MALLALLACAVGEDSGRGSPGESIAPDSHAESAADSDGCLDPQPWFRDADGDGFGIASDTISACAAPPGYVADATDCDDAHAEASPGATERLTDGVDDDCDGALARSPVDSLPTWSARGSQAGDVTEVWVGTSVGSADITGDGTVDLVVGTWASVATEGGFRQAGALVFKGPLLDSTAGEAISLASAVLTGDVGDGFALVCPTGDLDGDGIGDLVVGAPFHDGYTGAAYVVRGPIEGWRDLAADQALLGEGANAYFGQCTAPGDVDGDGLDDLLISAPNTEQFRGAAYLFRGPVSVEDATDAETIFRGEVNDEAVGNSVVGLGDLDGDGLPDFGITNYNPPDSIGVSAWLIGDPLPGVMHPRDVGVTVRYDVSGDGWAEGMTLNRLGDVTGDGYADVGFGVGQCQQSNLIAVMDGPFPTSGQFDLTTQYTTLLYSNNSGVKSFTSFATGLGDWDGDGDGSGDLAIGNPYYSTPEAVAAYGCTEEYGGCFEGAVFLVAGPLPVGAIDLETESDWLYGIAEHGELGASLAGGGDLDDDGFPDLAMGAPYVDSGALSNAGMAFVLFGGGQP